MRNLNVLVFLKILGVIACAIITVLLVVNFYRLIQQILEYPILVKEIFRLTGINAAIGAAGGLTLSIMMRLIKSLKRSH